MRKNYEQKMVLKEIKNYFEVYFLTSDPSAFSSAEHRYYNYLKEGGKKTLESIFRTAQREYCLSQAW